MVKYPPTQKQNLNQPGPVPARDSFVFLAIPVSMALVARELSPSGE